MWRTLLRRRYAGPLALAAVFAVVTALLGVWQWSRHTDRVEVVERIEGNYDAPARALDLVVPDGSSVATAEEWSRVEVSGTYDPDPLLVRNRPLDREFGYHVLSVLRPADGGMPVLVDRGWVPNAPTAAELPEVPPTPTEELAVTGWVRPTEPTFGRDLPEGQLDSINIEQAGQASGVDLRGGYVVMEAETTAAGENPVRPDPPEPPSIDLGAHQAYAFQWWLAVPVGFVLVVVKARRDWLDEEPPDETPSAAAGPGPDGAPVLVGAGSTRRRRSDRPKKVRIWDEEDE